MKSANKPNYLNLSSLAASYTGDTIDMRQIMMGSLHLVWTSATASFDLNIEVSNDGETWHELASQPVANDSQSVMVELVDFIYGYLRVKVVRTSGTLTSLKVHYVGKGSN